MKTRFADRAEAARMLAHELAKHVLPAPVVVALPRGGVPIAAVPVAPHDALQSLRDEVDEVVCLAEPEPFIAIGCHYRDFHQVSDDEVIRALDAAHAAPPPASG
jgi:predicted phosphoribosyltransferase